MNNEKTFGFDLDKRNFVSGTELSLIQFLLFLILFISACMQIPPWETNGEKDLEFC